VAVAVACVIGLYYFNHQADSDDEPVSDVVDTADRAGEEAAPPTPSGDPLAAPSDVAAPPRNAQRTPSGLASRVLRPGTGSAHPSATDRVTVHYTGWTTDGQMFDSSRRRGEPTTFPLNRVIAGWTEGVQLMVVGEQRRFWIPEALAYQGRPGAPAGMLVFDVELLSINQ
jgi:peptidylprolyl isomerase